MQRLGPTVFIVAPRRRPRVAGGSSGNDRSDLAASEHRAACRQQRASRLADGYRRGDIGHRDACRGQSAPCAKGRSASIASRRLTSIPMAPAMPVRRAFEYKRHGTLTLMGALDVRRGKVCATWSWAGPTGEQEARSRRSCDSPGQPRRHPPRPRPRPTLHPSRARARPPW